MSHTPISNKPLDTVVCPYLLQACTSLDIDIITFDLSKRLPFRFKPGPLQSAIKRGLHLEVSCLCIVFADVADVFY